MKHFLVFYKKENYNTYHYTLNHLFTIRELEETVLKDIDEKGKFEDDRYVITIRLL